MKSLIFNLVVLSLLVSSSLVTADEEVDFIDGDDDQAASDESIGGIRNDEAVGFGLIRGSGRMLAGQKMMTCNTYPRVCRVARSPGPDCCKKKCVNVDKDRANCGKCGQQCKYSEVCCKGKCVNMLRDKNNCGGCRKKCKKGFACRYGMCSYA